MTKYDVFISYSHKDFDWVNTFLLPKLTEGRIKYCIDVEHFEPGIAARLNMENAIDSSRKTMLVLSDNWLQSDWTAFEMLLGSSYDPSGKTGYLVPILIEEVSLPRSLSFLTYLDFTDKDSYQKQIVRLLNTLRTQSSDVINYMPETVLEMRLWVQQQREFALLDIDEAISQIKSILKKDISELPIALQEFVEKEIAKMSREQLLKAEKQIPALTDSYLTNWMSSKKEQIDKIQQRLAGSLLDRFRTVDSVISFFLESNVKYKSIKIDINQFDKGVLSSDAGQDWMNGIAWGAMLMLPVTVFPPFIFVTLAAMVIAPIGYFIQRRSTSTEQIREKVIASLQKPDTKTSKNYYEHIIHGDDNSEESSTGWIKTLDRTIEDWKQSNYKWVYNVSEKLVLQLFIE